MSQVCPDVRDHAVQHEGEEERGAYPVASSEERDREETLQRSRMNTRASVLCPFRQLARKVADLLADLT